MSIYQASGVKRFLLALSMVASACCGVAIAQPLDDVSLEYQSQGIVATIRLTGPVQYLRHFPESHGKTLEIFYDRVQGERGTFADKNVVLGEVQPKKEPTADEIWVDNEVRKSPPSGLIPSFTVTSRDQQTKPKLVIEFAREAEYSVAPGKDNRSLLVTIRPEKRPVGTGPLPFLPAIKPEVAAAPAAALSAEEANLAENNRQARALIVQGRDALAAKNNEAAVDAFNKLLLLPPNDYTQDGQEWVGVARERAGQIDKARIEYELYLRLYPEGGGAERVAQRLAGLAPGPAVAGAAEKKKQVDRWMTFGSISSRYYYGNSRTDSTYTFNNATTTSSDSYTDQSMLITSVDATERYVSEEYDGRLVFRDVHTKNFLSNQPSQNRVNAAYGEVKNRTQDYMLRLGQQPSTGGGVLGRFAGLSGSYGFAQDMHFKGAAGSLRDFSQGSQPVFVSASVDKGPLSVYSISQRVDSATDRHAVGTEYRYFEGNKTAFGLLDYDTYFKALNAAQVMGTVGTTGGTVNFMLDHRKTPSLSIRNALAGASTSSVDALLQTMSYNSLRELALARTATSNMGQIGITVPLSKKWQAGGDFRLTNTTGLQASGTTALEGILAAMPGRGTEKTVTGQIIGSGLYIEGDIWSGSITMNTSSAVSGHSLYLYNHTLFKSGWAMDTSLQMYRQRDQFGSYISRNSPMVRGAYRIKEQFYIDADLGYEFTSNKGVQQVIETKRYFYSAGLRWDF